MPKISVVPLERAKSAPLPSGLAGQDEARAYIGAPQFPLQLHLHRLGEGDQLTIGPMDVDCVAYVWHGEIEAGGCALAAGSSIIVERGASLAVAGGDQPAELLTFAACAASPEPLPGGHVHMLPAGKVPRTDDLGGGTGVGGAMHADSDCPTCAVWLHENRFPGAEPLGEQDQGRGVHSHTEDEIIFVLDGQIRLGNKLFGPGTALAIAADTLYSFTPGPEGLHFVNFRASRPGDIRFASGPSMSETGYWREKLPRPEYLEPVG